MAIPDEIKRTKVTEEQLNTLREFSKQAHTKFITTTIVATPTY